MMTIGGITFDTSVQDNTYLGAKKKKEVDAWQASGTFYKPTVVNIPKYVVPNTQAFMPKPLATIGPAKAIPKVPQTYMQQVKNGSKQLNFSTLYNSKAPNWQKTLLSPLAAVGQIGQWANGDLISNTGKVTGSKFLGRTLDTARMAATGSNIARTTNKGDITQPMNTGSKIGNLGASLLGTGLGFGVSQPLSGQTLNNSMNKIGAPVENGILKATSKFGLKPNIATKIGTSALKTGAEFGALNGAISLGRGDNFKQTLNNVGTGFTSGALFGAGGKAIGEASSFAKTMPKTSTLRQNVFDSKFGQIDNNNIPLQLNAGKIKPTGGINDLGTNDGTIIAGGSKETYTTPKINSAKGILKPNLQPFKADAYHGSNVAKTIKELKPLSGGELGDGMYFTKDKNYANEYTKGSSYEEPSKNAGVIGLNTSKLKIKEITKQNFLDDRSKLFEEEQKLNGGEWDSKVYRRAVDKLTANYEAQGYDGLHVADEKQGVVFPNSLKKITTDISSKEVSTSTVKKNLITNKLKPIVSSEKVTVDPLAPNWAGKAATTTEKTSNVITPKFNKVAPKIPKSDMVSSNMDKMPDKFIKIGSKADIASKTPKAPEKYVAPTDANGDLLPDPKIVSSKKADKTTFKGKLNNLYTSTVDKNKSIADFSKLAKDKTYTLATNSANEKNVADYIMTDKLVDKQGNVIGKSLKDTLKGIPKDKNNEFMNYALEKHNIDRARENKPIFPNRSSEQSAAKVKDIEAIHPEWKAKSSEITSWIDSFMNEWGVNAGTLDKTLADANRKTYPSYIPTNRDFSTIEQTGGFGGNGSKGFVNQTTPIKRATGSARDIIDPQENIANMVVRTVKAAKNNEVGQNLVKSIKSDPVKMNKYAEIVGEPKGNVNNIVRVLEGGKPTYVKINDTGLLKAMEKLNDSNVSSPEAAIKKVTNIYKQLITQKNPVFAIRNIARDLPTAYVNGSVHNPIKFGVNLLKAGGDVVTNSKSFQKYKGMGGGGSNFFDGSDPSSSIKELTGKANLLTKAIKAIPNGIEKFNNITESAPRLAEFKTVLKKTGDADKAMFAANDITTNFSRGGSFIKHADSVIPYLNASFQGIDKTVRQFKNHPLATTVKGAIGITAPTLALNYMNKDNENYKNLDNRTKDNYFLFPQKDGTFIKIPKARELGVLFASLAERTLRAKNGEKNAFKGYAGTVATNFAPSNPVENNFFSPLAYNIPKNKDFANRAIVPQGMIMDGRSPRYQYDEKTSELAKYLGDKINLSPKKIDYVIRSYTGVIGQMGLPALTKTPFNTPLQNALKPISTQFKADSLYSNAAVGDFYDNLDKFKQTAADKNISENIPSKTLTNEEAVRNSFNKASKDMTKINKLIKTAISQNDVNIYKQQIIDIAKEANKMVE